MKSTDSLNHPSLCCQEISPYDAETLPATANLGQWLKNAAQANSVDYDSDLELIGKQHFIVQGLKCQKGCDEYATERRIDVAQNGRPIELLICETCAFGGVDE